MYENNYDLLFDEVEDNTVIITATSRLKSVLVEKYLIYLKNNNKNAFVGDNIQSYEGFNESLWQKTLTSQNNIPKKITTFELMILFSLETKENSGAQSVDLVIAQKFANTLSLLNNYRVELNELLPYCDNKNTEYFYKSAKNIEKTLKKLNFCTESQKINTVCDSGVLDSTFKNKKIIMVGFQTLRPDFSNLLNIYKENGATTKIWRLEDYNKKGCKFYINEYENEDEELFQTAQNLKKKLEANPNIKIAVVTAKLHKQYEKITKVFDEVMLGNNSSLLSNLASAEKPYFIAGGIPLLKYPIVSQLISWLKILFLKDFEAISAAFKSPYIKSACNNKEMRYKFELLAKTHCKKNASINDILSQNLVHKYLDEDLYSILKNMHTLKSNMMNIDEFIRLSQNIIKIIGWCSEYKLNKIEFQTLEKYYQCLDSFRLVRRLNLDQNYMGWINLWQQYLTNTSFQPTTTTNKHNIHVLELMESTEIMFDEIYILQMHEDNWPLAKKINTYIPHELRTKYNMPHSSSQMELEFAEKLSKSLVSQAPKITISYAKNHADTQKNISPIFKDLKNINKIPNIENINNENYSHIMVDNNISKIEKESLANIKGGVSILKNIIACPYRSALIHRLKIKQPQSFQVLFSNLNKGNVIHKILEIFWKEHKTQKALINLKNEKKLDAIVKNIVEIVLKQEPYVIRKYLTDIEEKRLFNLIIKWLDYEISRTVDFKVIGTEETLKTKINDIPINVKIDRIDKLGNGDVLIIDYKSSKKFKIDKLYPEKMEEPQLPIYATNFNPKPQAVSIATVNGKSCMFYAISGFKDWVSKDSPKIYSVNKKQQCEDSSEYDSLLNEWEVMLYESAQRFIDGDSRINPDIKVCEYCYLKYICRHRKT